MALSQPYFLFTKLRILSFCFIEYTNILLSFPEVKYKEPSLLTDILFIGDSCNFINLHVFKDEMIVPQYEEGDLDGYFNPIPHLPITQKQIFQLPSKLNTLFRLYLSFDYSATAAAESTTALSATAALSSITLSTTSSIESVSTGAACSVLLPHAANETATTAANANTNFFIFF